MAEVTSDECVVCSKACRSHCPLCQTAYCGRNCQKSDWNHHKLLCTKKQEAASLGSSSMTTANIMMALAGDVSWEQEGADQQDAARNQRRKSVTFERDIAATKVLKRRSISNIADRRGSWRGACVVCLKKLDLYQTFYPCCCQFLCTVCSSQCKTIGGDTRCPFCRQTSAGTPEESLARMRKRADSGQAAAQFVLGTYYSASGELCDVENSAEMAFTLFEKAASQNHPEAQLHTGQCHYAGTGTPCDFQKAMHYFRLAGVEGLREAQSNVGGMFLRGEGVEQSYEEAMKWYKYAANQGLKTAQFNLAYATQHGIGCQKDDDEALRLFRLAAKDGMAEAKEAASNLELEKKQEADRDRRRSTRARLIPGLLACCVSLE